MGLFSFNHDKIVSQKYGVIKTSFLNYITPTMIVVVLMCIGLTYLNFDQVKSNFVTNVPLNSLIFLVFAIAMSEAFKNNVSIYHVARFFKRMEKQIQAPLVDQREVSRLKTMLETSAYLVNTQNSFELVDNLQKYGFPLVTDNDARIIKSKLGFRIRSHRGRVSFMAGLLVMLGLIGTFWGLLLTIGAVGDAMRTIADQADTLGSGSEEGGIGGIIQSISAPLQGMGLAFSTSLFGLSGSLVVGFFNYACTQAQDKAIEDFSRWIDENIPAVGTEAEKVQNLVQSNDTSKDAESVSPSAAITGQADGLQALDEHAISQIIYALKETADTQRQLSDDFKALLTSQSAIYEVLTEESADIKAIRETGANLGNILETQSLDVKTIRQTNTAVSLILEDLREAAYRTEETTKLIHECSGEAITAGTKVHSQLVKEQELFEREFSNVKNGLGRVASTIDQSNGFFEKIEKSMKTANANDDHLIREVIAVKAKIPQSEYEMIRLACAAIADSIHRMDRSLQENAKIMHEVVKEKNMEKMARILREMQNFWLQMRLGALDWSEKQRKRFEEGRVDP